MVRAGELTRFREVELSETTVAFGNVAHRFSAYAKSGTMNGIPFEGRGMISSQFVLTPDGWRMMRDGLGRRTPWIIYIRVCTILEPALSLRTEYVAARTYKQRLMAALWRRVCCIAQQVCAAADPSRMFTPDAAMQTRSSAHRVVSVPQFSTGTQYAWSSGVLKVIHQPDSSGEPTPAFASDAEVELAEQLRHKLEQRYLEAPNVPSSSQGPPVSATGSTTQGTTR